MTSVNYGHRLVELLKVEVMRLHGSAIFVRICAKILLLKVKQEKLALFMIMAQLDQFPQKFTCLYGILGPFFCGKLLVKKFGWAKEFTLRRSEG